jgi:hypothetical protein
MGRPSLSIDVSPKHQKELTGRVAAIPKIGDRWSWREKSGSGAVKDLGPADRGSKTI